MPNVKNTLYPPILDTAMPAFVHTDEARIYFGVSEFNNYEDDIQGLLYTVNRQDNNESELRKQYPKSYPIGQRYAHKVEIKYDEDKKLYYFNAGWLNPGALNFVPDRYYTVQIRFCKKDPKFEIPIGALTSEWLSRNAQFLSEYSPVTILKPIYWPRLNLFTDTSELKARIQTNYKRRLPDKGGEKQFETRVQFDWPVDPDTGEEEINQTFSIINVYGGLIFYKWNEEDTPSPEPEIIGEEGEVLPGRNDVKNWQQIVDSTEVLDNYTILLYKGYEYFTDDNLVYSTGKKYTSITSPNSIPTFLINYRLEVGQIYTLACKIETSNGYTHTDLYKIQLQLQQDKNIFKAWYDATEGKIGEGCVELQYNWNDLAEKGNCPFEILRRDKLKEQDWTVICTGKEVRGWKFMRIYDYLVESGRCYEYIYRSYDNDYKDYPGHETEMTPQIWTDYDDIYLLNPGDDHKQLRLEYQPNVSSFKRKVSESTYETLGGQFPIVVRNGNLNYRQFSLSAYISYESDHNHNFMSIPALKSTVDVSGTCLDDQAMQHSVFERVTQDEDKDVPIQPVIPEFYYERNFRDAAIQFLMDGKPKIFKSPSEGMMLVRLTDVSFAPNQTLGRKIWQVSATVTEIGECNSENLKKYGFIEDRPLYSIEKEGPYIPNPQPIYNNT